VESSGVFRSSCQRSREQHSPGAWTTASSAPKRTVASPTSFAMTDPEQSTSALRTIVRPTAIRAAGFESFFAARCDRGRAARQTKLVFLARIMERAQSPSGRSKSLILDLPEISLSPQLLARVEGRVPVTSTGVLHSALTARTEPFRAQWPPSSHGGDVDVVVFGARSAPRLFLRDPLI
jgi:primosomal protein N'